ncbi:clustered-asparagine-rich protein [Babesia ovis]|uniref:Clustered-asparagine-rich protein n=1 Tax=Babesia ovis TaxID=5869 RepID=A0A9W5TCK6_BABOV|nr:clustered-asparagine-rich protein [Babesia ovis]
MDDPPYYRSRSPARDIASPYPDPLNEKRLRIWVGNIPSSVNTKTFISALRDFNVPPLKDVVLKRCPLRSWSFLTFFTKEEAAKGISILHGTRVFEDAELPLEARFANPHDSKDNSESASLGGQSGELSLSGGDILLQSAYRNGFLSAISDDYEIIQEADDSTLWHMYKDENDIPYYYNHITGCTQWERPIPPMYAVESATSERSRTGSPNGTNLFIFHIPACWSDADLAMHFTPFGNLVSAKVQKDASGVNAGFGFVSYDNPQSAAAAVRLMKGYATNSKFLKVEYKKGDGN